MKLYLPKMWVHFSEHEHKNEDQRTDSVFTYIHGAHQYNSIPVSTLSISKHNTIHENTRSQHSIIQTLIM